MANWCTSYFRIVWSRKIHVLSCTDFLMACGHASLYATTIHLFYFPYSYHKLLVAKYGCKREKSQEAKRRSAEEQRPICEMERAVDVDLFLEAQEQWAKDSPHHHIILHEMFLHAASEGQKEVEWVVCRGCRWHMPQLDPEVGIPTIQLVHPEIDREKLLDLYLEVYKLHRLPGSPPGEPAILKEVSSALPCHSLEEKGTPDAWRLPNPKDFHPPQSRLSQWEREGSLDRSLARVHEVHRKVLSTAVTLEEDIKKLHRMKACSSPKRRHMDSHRPEERRRKRQCQASFSSQPTASRSADPDMPFGRMGSEGGDSDLGEPPQLQAEVASFLQGSSKMPEEEDEEVLPEPPISQSAEWVQWKVEKCDVPNWRAELSTVLLEDTGRLAWEVRASFQLPRHMHELDPKEAPFHAPPAPPCLHQQRFRPPIVSAFACRDIWEIPREKTVAYARALQCLTEQNNLPRRDQPCFLVESMAELRRDVGFYLSFTDEEVFQGVDLPKEEGSKPSAPAATTTDAPGIIATPEMPSIPKAAPKYAG